MEKVKKICPHCKNDLFIATISHPCIVNVYNDNSNKVIKENAEQSEIEIVMCYKCQKQLTVKDLETMGVPCKKCGKVVSADELNKEGVCEVCVAKETRSELTNASQEQLIRMLLDLEKKVKSSTVTEKKEEQIQKADALIEKKVEKKVKPRRKPKEEVKEPEPIVEDKKASEVKPEEPIIAEPVVEKPIVETETQIINDAQEAPFPDPDPAFSNPFESVDPSSTPFSPDAFFSGDKI